MEEKGRKMQEQKIKSNIESKKADDPAVTQNLQAEEEITEQDRERARFLGEEVGFSKDVNLKIVDVGKGRCVGKVTIEKRHLNPLNTVHGGVFFTQADTICGLAAASSGYGGPTVQGDMDYLRPVRGKEIRCTANVVKTGRTLTWVEGVITDDTETEVARTKFIYYRLKETEHFGFRSRE